jgi:hypothetical protein
MNFKFTSSNSNLLPYLRDRLLTVIMVLSFFKRCEDRLLGAIKGKGESS